MEKMTFQEKLKIFNRGKAENKDDHKKKLTSIKIQREKSLRDLLNIFLPKENPDKKKVKENKNKNVQVKNNSINEEIVTNIIPSKNIFPSEINKIQIQSYDDIIKNHPNELFIIINEDTIRKWEKNLISENNNSDIKRENNFSDSKKYENNFDNQKIIRNDVICTRVKESILVPLFHDYLEFIITYYCHQNNIQYKKVLNDIIAPMILLKYKLHLSFLEIYNLIQWFIDKFLINFFKEENIFALRSSFSLITLLLKYHLPLIYNLFDYVNILPEMYASNWITTAFSSKLRLDVVYSLWNILITINDSIFIFYLIVAYLSYNSNIITNTELDELPQLMSRITINSIDEVDAIYKIAIEMRNKTPYSFRILCDNLKIFHPNAKRLDECYEKYKLQSKYALPIFPSEIFYITYYSQVKCPNEICIIKKYDKDYQCHKCEYCDMGIKKNINYILLDMRIYEKNSTDYKNAFLPMMVIVEQEMLLFEDFANGIIEKYMKDKEKYHFVFLTTKTEYFKDFEDNNLYKDKEDEFNPFINMNTAVFKEEKEPNEQKFASINQKTKIKLKEYYNLKQLLQFLIKDNYPYISFVYGGFNALHEISFEYNIELLNHEYNNCFLCKEMEKKGKVIENKKFIKSYQKDTNNIKEYEKKEIITFPIPNIKSFDIKPSSNNDQNGHSSNLFWDNLTISKITKLIHESDYFISICYLKEFKKKSIISKPSSQIVLIITDEELKIYKIYNQSAYNYGINDQTHFTTNEELTKMETIPLINTKRICYCKKQKNAIEMDYTEILYDSKKNIYKEMLYVLIIEFSNENEAIRFISVIGKHLHPKEVKY